MTASQIQLAEKATSHLNLYYGKFVYGGGLNIQRAKSGYSISNLVLNSKEVETLEKFFATKGIEGIYKYTKSSIWVRCQNSLDTNTMVELAKFLRTNKINFGK